MLKGSSPGQNIKRLYVHLSPSIKLHRYLKLQTLIYVFSFHKSIIGGLGARDISNLNAVFANL